MTASTWPRALAVVLRHEGGWADHPADPGGATMRGITLNVFREEFGADRTADELRAISDAQVSAIYLDRYWHRIRGDDLPAGVDLALFDAAVNSGPGRAARWLQDAVGATADGVIGSITLRAARALPASRAIIRMSDAREAFLRRLPHWPTFGVGWLARVLAVRREALEIARAAELGGGG